MAISARKIEANRRNAKRSTGPRSAEGKARASRNAMKHGLAQPIERSGAEATLAERLAHALAGPSPCVDRLVLARAAALAELELLRIRARRVAMLNRYAALNESDKPLPPDSEASSDHACSPHVEQNSTQILEGLAKIARYERRAFSRRNSLLCNLQNETELFEIDANGHHLAERTQPKNESEIDR